MTEQKSLAAEFEAHRAHLQGVAYRMLGSLSEADDAVQEAWLRLSRSDADAVENLGGWLTTVVARVCLDILRARKARKEEALEAADASTASHAAPAPTHDASTDPEREAVLADSIGLALLVVLDTLAPAERLAFVLHDMFALPFEEIGPIVGRTAEATRQLASRARRRVQGAPASDVDLTGQRQIVSAFLTAMRAGDVEGIVAVLDPNVVVHVDEPGGGRREIRGARTWAKGAVVFSKNGRAMEAVLVDGQVGVIAAPGGHLSHVLVITFANGKIAEVDVVRDPSRIARLELAALEPKG